MTTVKIPPHALTAESAPAEGATVGYTGKAFYGNDFSEHGYVSCAIRVGEHTNSRYGAGFYATVVEPAFGEGYEIYVMFNDEGRQMLHGYTSSRAAA